MEADRKKAREIQMNLKRTSEPMPQAASVEVTADQRLVGGDGEVPADGTKAAPEATIDINADKDDDLDQPFFRVASPPQ